MGLEGGAPHCGGRGWGEALFVWVLRPSWAGAQAALWKGAIKPRQARRNTPIQMRAI